MKEWRRRQIAGEDEQEANCVKVKMEGAAIGRKVDLALHSSYHSLKTALFAMFGISKPPLSPTLIHHFKPVTP